MTSRATRTMTLGEMIPGAAWPEIMRLAGEGKRRASDFRPVLEKYAAEMEANGVLPAYAAYALEYAIAEAERANGG